MSTHIARVDPGYADHHTPMLLDGLDARYSDQLPVAASPTLRLLRRLGSLAFDTVRPPGTPAGTASDGPDPALDAIFVRNIRSISGINRARGVRTIWIGKRLQDGPIPQTGPMWAPYVRTKDVHALLAHLRSLLAREAAALGDLYLDAGETFDASHYTDGEHFSAKGSRAFATEIAPAIAKACGETDNQTR